MARDAPISQQRAIDSAKGKGKLARAVSRKSHLISLVYVANAVGLARRCCKCAFPQLLVLCDVRDGGVCMVCERPLELSDLNREEGVFLFCEVSCVTLMTSPGVLFQSRSHPVQHKRSEMGNPPHPGNEPTPAPSGHSVPPHHVLLPSRETLRYRPCVQTGIKTRAVNTKAQPHCLIVPGYHLTLCIK